MTREWSKRFVQQGRRGFGERSVHEVREHDKRPRTPLAAFWAIPCYQEKRGVLSREKGIIEAAVGYR